MYFISRHVTEYPNTYINRNVCAWLYLFIIIIIIIILLYLFSIYINFN